MSNLSVPKFLTLKLFNRPSPSSTKQFWKPILGGRETFVLGKYPPGTEYCVLLLTFVLPSAVNTLSICIKNMDQFVNQDVNLVLISQHSN